MESRFWSIAWILGASTLVALAGRDFFGWPLFATFVVAFVCLCLMYLVAWKLLKIAGSGKVDEVERVYQETLLLPLPDAQERAAAALSDPTRFRCNLDAEGKVHPDVAARLGPPHEEFFRRYGDVMSANGRVSLRLGSAYASLIRPNLVCIGDEGEHTEVAVEPNEASVYVLADDVPRASCVEATLPSIYHYIVYVDGTR